MAFLTSVEKYIKTQQEIILLLKDFYDLTIVNEQFINSDEPQLLLQSLDKRQEIIGKIDELNSLIHDDNPDIYLAETTDENARLIEKLIKEKNELLTNIKIKEEENIRLAVNKNDEYKKNLKSINEKKNIKSYNAYTEESYFIDVKK